MAKRKRLGAPDMARIASAETPAMALTDAPLGQVPPQALQRRAPIADVAGQAALTDALERVSGELLAAKSEGRMIIKLPLEEIDEAHILRDRAHVDPAEMEVLKASLAARGQQTPIEVVQLRPDRYGLISGWRRLTALRALAQEGGESHILALLRAPESASEAYTAMVEENEIRVGLSYFERARIVDNVVKAGVFEDAQAALNALFASASRAKRSKIKSFLPLVEPLGVYAKFPSAISERLGLALSARIGSDPAFLTRLKDRLRKAEPADAAAEMALLEKALAAKDAPADTSAKPAEAPKAPAAQPAEAPLAVRFAKGRITVEGAGVSEALAAEIERVVRSWRG
ncbi:MAG: ParB N-terminal domain-containing protein [Pseudomonadota bacterium]